MSIVWSDPTSVCHDRPASFKCPFTMFFRAINSTSPWNYITWKAELCLYSERLGTLFRLKGGPVSPKWVNALDYPLDSSVTVCMYVMYELSLCISVCKYVTDAQMCLTLILFLLEFGPPYWACPFTGSQAQHPLQQGPLSHLHALSLHLSPGPR